MPWDICPLREVTSIKVICRAMRPLRRFNLRRFNVCTYTLYRLVAFWVFVSFHFCAICSSTSPFVLICFLYYCWRCFWLLVVIVSDDSLQRVSSSTVAVSSIRYVFRFWCYCLKCILDLFCIINIPFSSTILACLSLFCIAWLFVVGLSCVP